MPQRRSHDEFRAAGVDDIYCLSVNDAFVMFQWSRHIGADNVKMLPDGNGEFTRKMGMLVNEDNLGFGMRSWRYAMAVNDGEIEHILLMSLVDRRGMLRVQYMGERFDPEELLHDLRDLIAEDGVP